MSSTAVINIRTDTKIKSEAQKITKELGLSLSAVINAYLRQLVRTKTVSFGLGEEPTDYLLQALRESKKDIKKGFVSPAFDNTKEALKWLKDPKAEYANQL